MADLSLPEWDGLLERVVFDFRAFGGQLRGFVNSARDWVMTYDSNGDPTGIEEPTDTLIAEFIRIDDFDNAVVPFKTSGWIKGGDTIARPTIQIADPNAVLFNQIRAMKKGANLAPVIHSRLLAEDVDADNGQVVGNPHHYMINKVSHSGIILTIELGTHGDVGRTKFPPYPMTEQDFPGLRNRYDRS